MEKKIDLEFFRKAGKRGGSSTLAKHGKDYFKKISQKGVEARKKRKEEDDEVR